MATPKKKTTKATPSKVKAKKASTTAATKKAVKKAEPKKTAAKTASKKEAPKKLAAKKSEVKSKSKAVKTQEAPSKNGVFRCSVSGLPVKSEKPNLNPKTLQKLKELLIEERIKHLAQADELELEAAELIADREAGDTQFDEESGEGDSIAVERERTLFLSAEAHNTVKQIDRALERIKDGSYGVCVPSSRRLPVARLEALPWTEVCVDCKARSERRR